MINKYNFGRVEVIEGKGSLLKLGEVVKRIGSNKVLIVTDQGLEAVGHVEKAINNLKECNIESVVYNGIKTDPIDTMVSEGMQMYLDNNCTSVIGLGGGSSMDIAKCVSIMVNNEGEIIDFTRISEIKREFIRSREPLILIPTTSGTGSELSPFAVVTNTKINRKSNISTQHFIPDAVILDATLVFTLNQKMTTGTGFDALCHIIDGYTVKNAILNQNIMFDTFALQGVNLVYNNLEKAYAIPNNYEARRNVMIGSHLGGAMLCGGTGATHGLANILSKYYHIPHGESVGMLLPAVMEYNLIACPDRFANIAEAMGIETGGLSDIEAGQKAIQAIIQLADRVHLPKLSDYIKSKEEIYGFLEESLHNSCNFTNARDITKDAAEQIFLAAFYRN